MLSKLYDMRHKTEGKIMLLNNLTYVQIIENYDCIEEYKEELCYCRGKLHTINNVIIMMEEDLDKKYCDAKEFQAKLLDAIINKL